MVEYTIKLDLSDNGYFDTGIRVKQGDYGNTRFVIFVVNNGESAFDRDITPQIAFKRPDGKTVVSNLTIGDNAYLYTFVGNELQIAGPIVMDVKLEDDQGRISTASCKFTCVEDTIGYDSTGAKTYNNPVSEIAEKAIVNSENSEAWAVGQRNGIDVGPDDETYHNNAKYWAEHSGSGSTAAAISYNNSKSGLIATNVQDAIDEQNQDLTQYEERGFLSKNLFNPSNVLNANISNEPSITSSGNTRLVYAKCEPNKTYTVSKMVGVRFQVAYTKALPNVGVNFFGKITNNSASSITITTGADAEYIVAFVYSSSSGDSMSAETMLASVQIEEGEVAHPYQEYVPSNTELKQSLNQLMPSGYSTEGLSFTNCSYQAGGYTKVGNLVIVNIRVVCNSNASFNMTGFPKYDKVANTNLCACSILNPSATIGNAKAFINQEGYLGVNNLAMSGTYVISGTYICN